MYSAADELSMSAEMPEFNQAAEAMEQAGKRIQLASLPIQKKVAECTLQCFKNVRDVWSIDARQGEEISKCMEKCEKPVGEIESILEEERNELVKDVVDCMQRCNENDEPCYKQCVTTKMSTFQIDGMVNRVINRMKNQTNLW
jgi:Eukaryotic protein of unknown function (DUF842)